MICLWPWFWNIKLSRKNIGGFSEIADIVIFESPKFHFLMTKLRLNLLKKKLFWAQEIYRGVERGLPPADNCGLGGPLVIWLTLWRSCLPKIYSGCLVLSTLISLIKVESTLTDFEKFHPPQKKSPLHVYWFYKCIPTSTFIPASMFSDFAIFASMYFHFSNNLKHFTLHK